MNNLVISFACCTGILYGLVIFKIIDIQAVAGRFRKAAAVLGIVIAASFLWLAGMHCVAMLSAMQTRKANA